MQAQPGPSSESRRNDYMSDLRRNDYSSAQAAGGSTSSCSYNATNFAHSSHKIMKCGDLQDVFVATFSENIRRFYRPMG